MVAGLVQQTVQIVAPPTGYAQSNLIRSVSSIHYVPLHPFLSHLEVDHYFGKVVVMLFSV
jgi:hypothetical protein